MLDVKFVPQQQRIRSLLTATKDGGVGAQENILERNCSKSLCANVSALNDVTATKLRRGT